MLLVDVPVQPCEVYRLFVEAPGFEFDVDLDITLLNGNSKLWVPWLDWCPDMDCLSIILRQLYPNWPTISVHGQFEILFRVGSHSDIRLDAFEFLQYLGVHISDPRLATLRSTHRGRLTLHHIAIFCSDERYRGRSGQDCINMGIGILMNGADASSLMVDEKLGSLTPLLCWLQTRK